MVSNKKKLQKNHELPNDHNFNMRFNDESHDVLDFFLINI